MPYRPGVILVAALCLAQAPPGPRILRPTDLSVVEPGPLTVIAKGESLELDGKALPASSPAPGVLTSMVEVSAGRHELVLRWDGGSEAVHFHAGAGAPAEFKPFRPHPPAANCDTCHAATGQVWTLKGEVAGPGCMECHDAASFLKSHTHLPADLEDCQMCHAAHGSTSARHLILPAETACKQCHG